jgi:hypothetical protein
MCHEDAERILSGNSVTNVKDLAQEQLGAFVLRMLEKRQGRVQLDNLASVHEHDSISHLARETHLVCHDDHRHPLLRELGHGIKDFLHHFRIK